ncbi:YdgA family protein [Pantoea sp. A4]|uniref:YdgA family protein n=1 Tax=Pantoea sp. A4 TaxID=1225184 RepID=UPI000373FDE1|nr:YdgA family protein [Pantoea sp. A4]
MKKSNIAVGVIVALGVLWTGAAWFTGKQLESHKDELVQQANARLQSWGPASTLTLTYQDYQRGIFSSHAKVVIQATAQTADNAWLKPGQSIVLDETIDHGPFPLLQLKHFNVIPSLAAVHSELTNTDAVKKLFDLTDNKTPLVADTRVGYAGANHTVVNLLALDYQNAQTGERFASSGGEFTLGSDSKGDKVDFDLNLPNLAVTVKNEDNQPILYTVNNLKMDGNTYLSPEGVRIGDQSLSLDKTSVTVNGQETLTLNDFKITSSFDSKENKIGGTIDYGIGKILLQQHDFGESQLKLTVANVDGQAMKTFSDNYNAQLQDLLKQQGLADDPVRYQEDVRAMLLQNLPVLLKGSPSVSIAPFTWKNGKGESSFTLNANFNDPATVTGEATDLSAVVDRVLKTLDAKLNINMPMATEVMHQVGLAEGYNADDAQKMADQQVKGLAAMGQMFRLTQQKDDNITTSLQYANGQVTMNGDKMTLAQFMSRYMLGVPTNEGMPQ